MIPKINSAHGSDTRNIINRAIEVLNEQGKSIQDLVAEGQLTPAQYATLIQTVNALISKGDVTFDDIDINKGKLLPKHLSEEVLKMLTGDAPVNAVPADGGVTTSKLADGAVKRDKLADGNVTRIKLSDIYNRGDVIESGTNLISYTKEGNHFKETFSRIEGLPEELGDGYSISFLVLVRNYGLNNVLQQIFDIHGNAPMYYRIVRNGSATDWVKVSGDNVSERILYNHNVFERYNDSPVSDTVAERSSAIQSVEIVGHDPEIPIGFWMICRNYQTPNEHQSWNHRIIMRKKVNGVWVRSLDTTGDFTVNESESGATDVEYTSSEGITLKARIDYDLIPDGERFMDQSTERDEPWFVIRPEHVKTNDQGAGGGEAYDQSLNTFDNVQFSTVKADAIEVAGELPTGSISDPPTGLMAGDMWLDTTDSAEHPILRVMT